MEYLVAFGSQYLCISIYCQAHNKFVNERTSCWTAKSVASPQRGPLQRRYVSMKIITILLAAFSSHSFACELTEEYKQARTNAYREANEGYRACVASVGAYFHYKAVAKCTKEGRGKNVAGGCYHVAGYEQTKTPENSEHCKVLKPTVEQVKEYFNSVVSEQNITKCSSSLAPLTGTAKSVAPQQAAP